MFVKRFQKVPDQSVRRCCQLVQFGQKVVVVVRRSACKCRTVAAAAIIHVVDVVVIVVAVVGRRLVDLGGEEFSKLWRLQTLVYRSS